MIAQKACNCYIMCWLSNLCMCDPFPDFLGRAWGWGYMWLMVPDLPWLSPFYIIVNTNWRGRPGNEGTLSPDTCHGLHYTHHLRRVVGRGNWGGDVDHPRLSWSCRNPPVEEVYQTSYQFQWFHIRQNLSRSGSVRSLLGASWRVKECFLWHHFLWWGSSDMGPCWVSLLQSLVRSSRGTTPVPGVQYLQECKLWVTPPPTV